MSRNAINVERKSSGSRTVVLVGRTGNGKSATGNRILGRDAFKSKKGLSGVTSTCELQPATRDGQVINVIDTPGLFDVAAGSDFVGKEIVKCMNLAKDGIHAFLLVFTVRTRFSEEEAAAIRTIQTMFGSKIVNHMIIVFTGGDELEKGQTLDDYLGEDCPQPLKELLTQCKQRKVLFDNKTADPDKKAEQVKNLLTLVEIVTQQNGGQPYTNEHFVELQKGATKLREKQEEVDASKDYSKQEMLQVKKQLQNEYEELIRRTTETMEAKFKEATSKLIQQLEEERAARMEVERNMLRMSGDINKTQNETTQLWKKVLQSSCAIM